MVTVEAWMAALIGRWGEQTLRADEPLPSGISKKLAAALKPLSDGLIGDRELVGEGYLDGKRALGAYLVYFWPASYAQACRALDMAGVTGGARALDLGCGPGPATAALLDRGFEAVVACDRAEDALALAASLDPTRVTTARWNAQADAVPEGPFDVIFMGHLLNELWADAEEADALAQRRALCERALAQLAPGGKLILVEPALKATSRQALALRDALVGRGHTILAPCLHQGPCPALASERDWCHTEQPWQPPEWTAQITRQVGIGRRSLKMTCLVFAPGARALGALADPAQRPFRIVSDPLHSKGKWTWIGCGPEGRVGLVLMKRDLARHNKVFRQLQRGDIISVSATRERGDGLALSAESRVQVLLEADALDKTL